MTDERIYPYVLSPKLTPAIWGGTQLVERYGKAGDPHAKLGETWECWDENRVTNGPLAGNAISELRERLGAEFMGRLDPARQFPILTKIIDAHDALSVQVHPDDAYAQRVEHEPNGKTECWYILAAQPGAELVLGWTRDTDRDEYARRVADGTLGEILRRVPVKAGEVFYLPSGSLHAIGAGIVIFETQQASDLTYRIFDWNRVDANGKPRTLHVEKAADVLDFRASVAGAIRPLVWASGGAERALMIAAPRFSVERVRLTGTESIIPGRSTPYAMMALESALTVSSASGEAVIAPYETVIIPATAGDVTLSSTAFGAEVLVTVPEPDLAALRDIARAGGVSASDSDRFFGQFVRTA